jgi:phosphatidylserine/phosphatidylglycerophosphate/cardiolipin synthase-like enzyme
MSADPGKWFLQFSSSNPDAVNGDGRPWGDGTAIAGRARLPVPRDPWDERCQVTTYTDGFAAMSAMRDALEHVIQEATAARASGTPAGKLGHVYITDWRFNCLRDLSDHNPWGLDPWTGHLSGTQAQPDQTAIGLVIRLLQAGVAVRMMIWCPTEAARPDRTAGLGPHIEDHFFAARIVAAETERLSPAPDDPLGIVALDLRTAESTQFGSHHQKMMVIRSGSTNLAFVGGVDLAYTRRAAPVTSGDWQSGVSIPDPTALWPKSPPPVDYGFLNQVPGLHNRQPSDLPVRVYGDSSTAVIRQIWHDQHLKLGGQIVATIEQQFVERWIDMGRAYDLSRPSIWRNNQVLFNTPRAFSGDQIGLLPLVLPVPTVTGTSLVQMWRTIPLRKSRNRAPFRRGEFTVMAGIANAVSQAQELILMFDQYYWSRPLARLLNAQLVANPRLHVIIVLPPHADSQTAVAHVARQRALEDLTVGLTRTAGTLDRVAIYNLWYLKPPGIGDAVNRGIYVHAKSHTYDNSLLVCGSANLNRRSFLCDTELACAVLDPAVVTSHQQQLWSLLFDGAARPNVDLDTPGAGKQFFNAFRTAAAATGSLLIPDPWEQTPPRLPNGVERDVNPHAFQWWYDHVLDPGSVNLRVEDLTRGDDGTLREVRLNEVVARLEALSAGGRWPYRRP